MALNVRQLSDYLPEHPTPETIRNWVSRGTVPFEKSGPFKNSRLVFHKDEIDSWIANGRVMIDDFKHNKVEIINVSAEDVKLKIRGLDIISSKVDKVDVDLSGVTLYVDASKYDKIILFD